MGKTSLLEDLAVRCMQEGGSVIWLGASNDNESLAVCRAGGGLSHHVRLIGDDSVTVENCKQQVVKISEFDPRTIPRQKWYVLARCLFPTQELYSKALVNIVAGLKERAAFKFQIAVCLAETAEFVKAKILTGQSKTEREGSAEIESLARQLAHFGVSLIFDVVNREKTTSLELRSSTSFTYLKNQGLNRLDKGLYGWMFRYITDDLLRRLRKNEFLLINDAGGLAYGQNQICDFHHERGEDLLGILGWTISFNQTRVIQEEAATRVSTGAPVAIGQAEHEQICEMKEVEGLSLNVIAQRLDRSRSSVQESYNRHLDGRCKCLTLKEAANGAKQFISAAIAGHQ
jgi:hypothetical protein